LVHLKNSFFTISSSWLVTYKNNTQETDIPAIYFFPDAGIKFTTKKGIFAIFFFLFTSSGYYRQAEHARIP